MCEIALSALAEVNPPSRVPAGLSGNDSVSFIPMNDVSESGEWRTRQTRPLRKVRSGFTAFESGDVLVAKITPCLENGKGTHATNLENRIGFGSTEFHVLRAKPGVNSRYIFHITQWPKFRHAATSLMVGSAGQQRVPRGFFDEFLVGGFARTEQQKIAQILDTLDTAIQQTEAIIAKLKAMKQGLLHDLLTRGVDANGELRPPQSEAPHLYKQSPLGWIPREWDDVHLGEVLVDIDGGWSPSCPEETPSDGEWGVLKVSAISSGKFNPKESKRLPAHLKPISSIEVKVGDVLLARANGVAEFVGTTVLVRETPSRLMLSDKTLRLIPDHSVLIPGHLARVMSHSATRTQINGMLNGSSGQRNISQHQIRALRIPVPHKSEQIMAEDRVIGTELRLNAEVQSFEKLKNQKSALMNDLLTGRVRVTPLLEQSA